MARRVSIIVCTYNARSELEECLESLSNQTYEQTEIIVVDDASTDGTDDFLQGFAGKTGEDMRHATNKQNLGVAGSRNVGIYHATGEIVAFTDADCVADPHWISELVKGYEHEGVAAVGGNVLHRQITNIWELSDKGHDFVASEEGYVPYIVGCNMSFDRSIFGGFLFNDELKYGYEEALLCDDLIHAGHRIYYRPQAVVHHRHRSTMRALLRRKYLLGVSSIWYRKKQGKLFMFKRHLLFFVMLCCIPFLAVNKLFSYLFLVLFLIFSLSLIRDEIIFGKKSIKEMIIAFPFLIIIELSHFIGSMAGLAKFRVFNDSGQ